MRSTDVSGAIGIAHNAAECLPDFAQVRWLHDQKILGRSGVVAGAGDRVAQRSRGRDHQMTGSLEPPLHQVGMRRLSERLFERTREMRRASPCDRTKIPD